MRKVYDKTNTCQSGILDIAQLIMRGEKYLRKSYDMFDDISFFNQKKVLNAFRKLQISPRHFASTSGYGYDDVGRDMLSKLFAEVFGTESAIVSPLITGGTHAISLALFGLLRPYDKALCITGKPYDTLEDVISGTNKNSLKDNLVSFKSISLKRGSFDKSIIHNELINNTYKVVYIQRSRGYEWRDSISMSNMKDIIAFIKQNSPSSIIVVDNCYGEFTCKTEPTDVGADVVVGSLIKNPGGGLAPTGAYIVGTNRAIEQISYKFTSPSLGLEVGSYFASYEPYFKGLFVAPSVVSSALKGGLLAGYVFSKLGYKTLPRLKCKEYSDIVRSIKFNSAEELIDFCQSIQYASPVDSHVTPYPWDMPGYSHQVIMSAGTFVQGASIELTADSPIKKPYIAYIQGGLTYEHIKIAILEAAERINSNKNHITD